VKIRPVISRVRILYDVWLKWNNMLCFTNSRERRECSTNHYLYSSFISDITTYMKIGQVRAQSEGEIVITLLLLLL